MLTGSRYAKHFKIIGDTKTHYGPFDCSPDAGSGDSGDGGSCC